MAVPSMDAHSNGCEHDDGIQSCMYCIYFSHKLCNFLESSLCQSNCVTIIYILPKNILLYISSKLIRSKNVICSFFLNCTQPFHWHTELSLVERDDSFRVEHLNLYLTLEWALKKQYPHEARSYTSENIASCEEKFHLYFIILKIWWPR